MHSSDTTKKQPKKIAAPGQESRRFVRVECVLRAEFRLHNHDAWLPAEVLDLSVAGMKLRFNPFQRGRPLLPEVFEWADSRFRFPLKREFFHLDGHFLKIYNYHQDGDSMAALHAKVIPVDQKQMLITSANLSYHGQQGNIELGALVESAKIAKQLDDVFTKLIFGKVFEEV